ncbi:MAG TPA: hypothetical protein VNZ45_08535, partial [Bacteroidia bacterium]|nr:hypothetical protein [Bacteroidia bacterium]
MKKLLVLSMGIICAGLISAQNSSPKEIHYADGSFYKQCIYVKSTKPLTELIKERDAKLKANPMLNIQHVASDAGRENFKRSNHFNMDPNAPMIDEARQSVNGTEKMGSGDEKRDESFVNFDGQGSIGGYPMDPNGMIGTKYYVQTINSSIEVWPKAGGPPYIPQTDLYGLFGSLGSCDCGDPVTIYDKTADRWIISEFEGGITNPNIDTLLFAVSQTNDPGGNYWLYAFVPDINSFDDYPKYNVWGDGYYMTCNCNPDYVVAYQRDSMLVGGNAGMIALPWNYGPYNLASCGGNFFCPMMLDCDGTLPPFGSPEYLFYYWDVNWGCGGSKDSICIEQITMNWATKTGKIKSWQHIVTAAFNSNFNGGFDQNIPQPGNNLSDYMASSDGFFAYRIPYLRWSSYNSAVMVNPVNVGTFASPVSGERWYELHQDTTTKLWSIYQQSTYAPADGISRWNGTIAMDQNGGIGLAYNVSDPVSVYPGIRYTGRKSCDPLNTMTMAEVTAVSGNTKIRTPQSGGNRWGDYSHLSLDPTDGITFWHTNMYSNSGFSGFTNMDSRIVSFQVGSCPLGVNE